MAKATRLLALFVLNFLAARGLLPAEWVLSIQDDPELMLLLEAVIAFVVTLLMNMFSGIAAEVPTFLRHLMAAVVVRVSGGKVEMPVTPVEENDNGTDTKKREVGDGE